MGKSLAEVFRKLPATRQRRIKLRTKELLAEELSLRDVRVAREMTQDRLAKILDVGQYGISRIEKRSDLLLSTLQEYVHALGGKLSLVAEFGDRAPIILAGFGDLPSKPRRSRRRMSKGQGSRRVA